MDSICETSDLLVFSHLRWDFVFQRPQHLMSRFAKYRRVYYIEEPLFGQSDFPCLEQRISKDGVNVIIPHLPSEINNSEVEITLKELIDELIFSEKINVYSAWYYTPMALPFTRHLRPAAVLFDCMDELSLFKNAPQTLLELETELMKRAHVVFTGGVSLYQAKKHLHHNIHPFPSSIDYDHFSKARKGFSDPEDQKKISYPRIGFYGVIDERFDIELLNKMAILRPKWSFIVVGPVLKIDPETLAQRENIFYLGKKDYEELPRYLSGWDCAMMPFALNESTRFISPTKTPEFLAAGKPVVSTAIHDVVHPYEDEGLAAIAHDPQEFVSLIEKTMKERKEDPTWTSRVDKFLTRNSWDKTFREIAALEKDLFNSNLVLKNFEGPQNYIVLNEVQ